MEHHILLSFLSNYQPKKEFISSTSYETENGKISGYNSSEPTVKYVIKCLGANYSPDMTNAGKIIEEWTDDYNRNRPQKGLKGLTPEQFKSKLLSAKPNLNSGRTLG